MHRARLAVTQIFANIWVSIVIFEGQTGSIYYTVAVSIERFLVVKYPIKAKYWCSYKKTRRVAYAIFAFSVLYNIPRWWEVRAKCVWWPMDNEFIQRIRFHLRVESKYANIYVSVMFLVFIQGIPFVALLILNISIYREVSNFVNIFIWYFSYFHILST